jgi:hypothetical protein
MIHILINLPQVVHMDTTDMINTDMDLRLPLRFPMTVMGSNTGLNLTYHLTWLHKGKSLCRPGIQ